MSINTIEKSMFKYSIVIPVYNSTDSLYELTERIFSVFENKIKKSFEIIFVDDCSPNVETWPIIEDLVGKHENIKAFQLMRNFGRPGAVMCGFNNVSGEHVFLMDDDLQHLPEDFPAMIAEMDHDIVIAAFEKKQHSYCKRLSSNIKVWLDYKLLGKPKHIRTSAFVLLKRVVVDVVTRQKITYPYISGLLFFATKDIVNVAATHGKRKFGETGYTLRKSFKQFSNFIFNNSSVLLKMVASIGVIFSIFSFILAFYYLYQKVFVGIGVTGFATIIVTILLSSGLILISLGILGEYFIRLINGVEERPAYIVRSILDESKDE